MHSILVSTVNLPGIKRRPALPNSRHSPPPRPPRPHPVDPECQCPVPRGHVCPSRVRGGGRGGGRGRAIGERQGRRRGSRGGGRDGGRGGSHSSPRYDVFPERVHLGDVRAAHLHLIGKSTTPCACVCVRERRPFVEIRPPRARHACAGPNGKVFGVQCRSCSGRILVSFLPLLNSSQTQFFVSQ